CTGQPCKGGRLAMGGFPALNHSTERASKTLRSETFSPEMASGFQSLTIPTPSWPNPDGQLPCRWKPALRARSSRTLASGSAPTTRSPGTSTVGEVAATAGASGAYDTGAGAAPTVEPKMLGGKAEHPQWAPAAIITAAAVAIVFNVMSHLTHLLRGVRSHSSYATPPKRMVEPNTGRVEVEEQRQIAVRDLFDLILYQNCHTL